MRSLTVAYTTFRESVRQPAFYALLVLGSVLLILSYLMPTFTLENDEVKFIRDMGLGTYTLCMLLLGIFSASNLITTEIENKTAMTVMSKPLRRHEFVLGKFFGIALSVAFLGFLLTVVFVSVTVLKVVGGDIVWRGHDYEATWPQVVVIFPGLILGLFQVLVLTAVSVALSTRLPMVLNVSISFALYLIASISGPLLSYLTERGIGAALNVAKLLYYLLPNFQSSTEVYSAIGLGRAVPMSLVALTVGYSILYIGAAMSIACLMFQDRELG